MSCLPLTPQEFDAALTAASAGVLGTARAAAASARPFRCDDWRRSDTSMRRVRTGGRCRACDPSAGGPGREPGTAGCGRACRCAGDSDPQRESPGARRALQRYERERRSGNALMGSMVGGLDQLFTGSEGSCRGRPAKEWRW